MTLAATTKDTGNARTRPDDAERPPGAKGQRRSGAANGYATELRTLLAPDERWMVAAYGE